MERLPQPFRTRARSFLVGHLVKFVGTARLDIEELSHRRAVVATKNRPLVQNHIGSVHAAAMVLIPDPRDVRALVKSLAQNRVTLAPAVPALINAVLNYPRIEQIDLTSIKRCFSGSAPLSAEVRLLVQSRT